MTKEAMVNSGTDWFVCKDISDQPVPSSLGAPVKTFGTYNGACFYVFSYYIPWITITEQCIFNGHYILYFFQLVHTAILTAKNLLSNLYNLSSWLISKKTRLLSHSPYSTGLDSFVSNEEMAEDKRSFLFYFHSYRVFHLLIILGTFSNNLN